MTTRNLNIVAFYICTTLCFWLNLWVDITPSSQVSVPSEFIYTKSYLPSSDVALNLTSFVTVPWKENKLLKLARFWENTVFWRSFFFFFQRKCASSVMSVMYRWWELVGTVNVLQQHHISYLDLSKLMSFIICT